MAQEPEERNASARTRRGYPRVRTPILVRIVEPSGESLTGEADNLSPLGIKVRDARVAPSSIVHLEFELPGGGPMLDVASSAVRNDPDGVAFSFVDLTRPTLAALRQAVDLLLLGRKLWVLIVEDDAEVAALLADALEAEGHAPIVIGNAEDALAYLAHDRPDAVLLDLSLPGMSGLEFLEALDRRGARLPVLVISGPSVDAAARCLALGALDLVQKPLDRRQLRASLAALELRSLEERLADVELQLGA